MKIQCQSCQAKYTIADEKVLGKVVKIRCKKCSSTIVINGNEQAASADAGGAGTDVFDYASGSNEPWTVNVADGDQRTMTIEEIVAEYKTGVVNDETYCWKDGMADWLPLREVEQIAAAVKGGPKMAEEVSVSPQSVPPPSAGIGGGSSGSLFGTGGGGGDSPFAAAAHTNGNGNGGAIPTALFGGGAAAVEQAAPAAARRAGGRGQGGDLFGNVEKAGAEDDVMTSAAGAGMAGATDEKLTGQRNENSVLFSLSSLTDKKDAPPAGNRTTATADGSGLIDIRALSANMDEGDKKRKDTGARVDDIMNLSGGGAFGAALAAPILAPPPLETVDLGVVASAEQPKQNKTLLFAILGGCALIAIAIVAVAMMMKSPAPETKTPGSGAAPDTTATATSTVAANDTSAPPTTTTAAPAATDTPPPPGTGAKGATAPAGAKAGSQGVTGVGKTGGAVAAADPPAPAPAPAPAAPKSFQDQLDEAAGKHSAPAAQAGGGGSTAPFDRGAASASLSGINVSSCKVAGGPTGQGHVTVTFLPDGSVQSAVVDQGPFPGTSVAGCVGGRFKGAHVPPFGGAPVRVGKSFSIN